MVIFSTSYLPALAKWLVILFGVVILILAMLEMLRNVWTNYGQSNVVGSTIAVMILAGVAWLIFGGLVTLSKGRSPDTNGSPGVTQSASASGGSTVNQAGGNLTINQTVTPPEMSPPRFSEKFDRIFIGIGGNTVNLPNVEGARLALFGLSNTGGFGVVGMGFKNPQAGAKTTAFPEGGTIPAVAFVSDHQVFIDAEIFAGLDRPAMHVRRNEISDRPPKWDKNTDGKHALEIVNEDLVPVLQIIYSDEARASIKGVFVNGNNIAVANDRGLIGVSKEELVKHVSPRLFKYPAWKYPGVFEKD
jgi:hypothetical protein